MESLHSLRAVGSTSRKPLILYNWQNSLTLAHFSSLQTLVTFKLTAFAGIAQYL
jgi:hypothetical protein